VLCVAYVHLSIAALDLRVAFEAEIRIAFDQKLPIHRAMRIVANRAAFAHRLVLEYERPRLLAMALRAIFILPRHRQPARRFKNVHPVRVVALDAIHLPFNNGMMLWQVELGLRLQMALETRRRVLPWVNDELAAATTGFNVLAARAVARFATGLALQRGILDMNARMRAHSKSPRDIRVAIVTGLITGVRSSGYFRRRHHGQ